MIHPKIYQSQFIISDFFNVYIGGIQQGKVSKIFKINVIIIFQKGEKNDYLYFIEDGEVELKQKNEEKVEFPIQNYSDNPQRLIQQIEMEQKTALLSTNCKRKYRDSFQKAETYRYIAVLSTGEIFGEEFTESEVRLYQAICKSISITVFQNYYDILGMKKSVLKTKQSWRNQLKNTTQLVQNEFDISQKPQLTELDDIRKKSSQFVYYDAFEEEKNQKNMFNHTSKINNYNQVHLPQNQLENNSVNSKQELNSESSLQKYYNKSNRISNSFVNTKNKNFSIQSARNLLESTNEDRLEFAKAQNSNNLDNQVNKFNKKNSNYYSMRDLKMQRRQRINSSRDFQNNGDNDFSLSLMDREESAFNLDLSSNKQSGTMDLFTWVNNPSKNKVSQFDLQPEHSYYSGVDQQLRSSNSFSKFEQNNQLRKSLRDLSSTQANSAQSQSKLPVSDRNHYKPHQQHKYNQSQKIYPQKRSYEFNKPNELQNESYNPIDSYKPSDSYNQASLYKPYESYHPNEQNQSSEQYKLSQYKQYLSNKQSEQNKKNKLFKSSEYIQQTPSEAFKKKEIHKPSDSHKQIGSQIQSEQHNFSEVFSNEQKQTKTPKKILLQNIGKFFKNSYPNQQQQIIQQQVSRKQSNTISSFMQFQSEGLTLNDNDLKNKTQEDDNLEDQSLKKSPSIRLTIPLNVLKQNRSRKVSQLSPLSSAKNNDEDKDQVKDETGNDIANQLYHVYKFNDTIINDEKNKRETIVINNEYYVKTISRKLKEIQENKIQSKKEQHFNPFALSQDQQVQVLKQFKIDEIFPNSSFADQTKKEIKNINKILHDGHVNQLEEGNFIRIKKKLPTMINDQISKDDVRSVQGTPQQKKENKQQNNLVDVKLNNQDSRIYLKLLMDKIQKEDSQQKIDYYNFVSQNSDSKSKTRKSQNNSQQNQINIDSFRIDN